MFSPLFIGDVCLENYKIDEIHDISSVWATKIQPSGGHSKTTISNLQPHKPEIQRLTARTDQGLLNSARQLITNQTGDVNQ